MCPQSPQLLKLDPSQMQEHSSIQIFCRCCFQSQQQWCKSMVLAAMTRESSSSSFTAWPQGLNCGFSPPLLVVLPPAPLPETPLGPVGVEAVMGRVCKPTGASRPEEVLAGGKWEPAQVDAPPSAHRGRGQGRGHSVALPLVHHSTMAFCFSGGPGFFH